MEYLHREFDLAEGDVVEVNLAGTPANVLLLDTENFHKYQQGKAYDYYGRYVRTTPYRLQTPAPGRWHLVVDLAGGAGNVSASTSIIREVHS